MRIMIYFRIHSRDLFNTETFAIKTISVTNITLALGILIHFCDSLNLLNMLKQIQIRSLIFSVAISKGYVIFNVLRSLRHIIH